LRNNNKEGNVPGWGDGEEEKNEAERMTEISSKYFDFEDFVIFWEDTIKKIEETPMSTAELEKILSHFVSNTELIQKLDNLVPEPQRIYNAKTYYPIFKLTNKLFCAACISLSKWKEKNPGFWTTITSGGFKVDKLINVESIWPKL
jgi:hypothetical protein